MTDQDTTVSGRRLLTRRNMLIGSGGAVVAAGLATAGVTLLSKPPPRARLVWRYQGGGRYRIDNDFAGAGPPRLALSGGRIFASDAFGSVVALRASDGTVLWQRAVTIASAPVVAGSAVYVSDAGGTVYALRAADGTQLWQARVNAPGDTADDNPPQLCAAGGVVYAMRNSVFALRASDGHVLWTAPAGNDGYGPLAADAARVYVGDLLAGLHALSARDGSAAWLFHDRARGANPAPLTPVAAGPVVYAEGRHRQRVRAARRRRQRDLALPGQPGEQRFVLWLRPPLPGGRHGSHHRRQSRHPGAAPEGRLPSVARGPAGPA